MKIGIDIDDVVCDTYSVLNKALSEYYHMDLNELFANPKSVSEYERTIADYHDFAKYYYEKIMNNAPLKTDVVKYLNKLKQAGHQLIFITARSTFGFTNPHQITLDYFKNHHIPYDEIIVGASNKKQVCYDNEVQVMIDDFSENLIGMEEIGVIPILFTAPYNTKETFKYRVDNWGEAYHMINQLRS